MFFKRLKVFDGDVDQVLREFLSQRPCNLRMIVIFDVSKRGNVRIYSNYPGRFLGKYGADWDLLVAKLKVYAHARSVKLFPLYNYLISDKDDNGDTIWV